MSTGTRPPPPAIAEAQQQALAFDNGQPAAIVYRTTKGWQYGVEGRASDVRQMRVGVEPPRNPSSTAARRRC